MFFSIMKAALALPTLAMTSLSVPPCLLMMLLKKVRELTSCKASPSTVTGLQLEVLILIMLVFLVLILHPMPRAVVASLAVFSCICL